MRYNKLGCTGLFVSELCLGTMTFGGAGGDMWAKIGQLGQGEADALVRSGGASRYDLTHGDHARRSTPHIAWVNSSADTRCQPRTSSAGWDKDILAVELQALVDVDFNVELTGFSLAEVDLLIDEVGVRP